MYMLKTTENDKKITRCFLLQWHSLKLHVLTHFCVYASSYSASWAFGDAVY